MRTLDIAHQGPAANAASLALLLPIALHLEHIPGFHPDILQEVTTTNGAGIPGPPDKCRHMSQHKRGRANRGQKNTNSHYKPQQQCYQTSCYKKSSLKFKQQDYVRQLSPPTHRICMRYTGMMHAPVTLLLHTNWKVYINTDGHSQTKVVTDLQIQLPCRSHKNKMEVKIDGRAVSCVLTLCIYCRMFPDNLNNDGLLYGLGIIQRWESYQFMAQ